MSRSGKEHYEIFIAQAVCSALADSGDSKKEGGTRLQEEATQKTIAFAVKSSKLTADVLKKLIKMYLDNQKQKSNQPKHGKQTVKELVGQNAGVSNIEITDSNIKSFERVAKKYSVDFAVKKDKTTEPPKYLVFFKGRDADVLTQAFKEFVKANEKKQTKVSVREKLAQFREILSKDKNRERTREHQKDRGQAL